MIEQVTRLPVPLSGGHETSARGFWYSWPSEPLLVLAIFSAVAVYVIGRARLHAEAPAYPLPIWRAACYGAGVFAFALALLSPIAAYSERLFSMHMVQHLLLLLVAPPLILLGMPFLPALWALPKSSRKTVGGWLQPGKPLAYLRRWLALPIVALACYVVTVAMWHIPVFYDAAQGRTFTHDLEHLMFYSTALLYWWPIVSLGTAHTRLTPGWALPYLVPPFLEGLLIGALLAFSSEPLYSTYAELDHQPVWGLNWLDDQELGGLIMWVPGGMFFLIPLLGILSQLLHDNEQDTSQPHSSASVG